MEKSNDYTNYLKEQGDYLDEFVDGLHIGLYWDIDYLDFKCYKQYCEQYNIDILKKIKEFSKNSGKDITYKDASWVMYMIATGRDIKEESFKALA